jgi:hypothetical protein
MAWSRRTAASGRKETSASARRPLLWHLQLGESEEWENQSFIPPRPSAADGSSAPGGEARWSGKEIPKAPREGTEGGWHGSRWTAAARNAIEAKAAGETFSARQGSKISSGAPSRNTALPTGTGARPSMAKLRSSNANRPRVRGHGESGMTGQPLDSSRPHSRFG